MPFTIKDTQNKEKKVYKSIYMSEETMNKVQALATANKTSFNNVVISMIEYCLEEEKET